MINHGITNGLKYSCYSPFPVWASEGKFGDGGLIILSRYPMVQSRFCPFKSGASADKLAMKGILYAQIILPCTSTKKANVPAAHEKDTNKKPEEKQTLHLFNMHTQASYLEEPCTPKTLDLFVETFVVRNSQVLQANDFIAKTMATEFSKGDLIMFSGDFNINGAPECAAEERIKAAMLAENEKRKDGTIKK